LPKSGVEYATDQITVYRSCPYKCKYCYVWNSKLFSSRVLRGKYDPVEEASKYLKIEEPRTIVISFVSDPYPPEEVKQKLTRKVLEILAKSKHKIMVLTKNPLLALRDQDIMMQHKNVWLGSTVISHYAFKWEPNVPSPSLRFSALKIASCLGIRTWLSIEPIIPTYTFPSEIIEITHNYIDFYVLGAFNYSRKLGFDFTKKEFKEWYRKQVPKAIEILEVLHKPYFVKKELKRWLE